MSSNCPHQNLLCLAAACGIGVALGLLLSKNGCCTNSEGPASCSSCGQIKCCCCGNQSGKKPSIVPKHHCGITSRRFDLTGGITVNPGAAAAANPNLSVIKRNLGIVGNAKASINGTPVFECTTDNLRKGGNNVVDLPSKCNPPKLRTAVTTIGDKYYAIANVNFGSNIKVQFVALDGGRLTEDQFNDPDYVIQQYKNGGLQTLNASRTMSSDDDKAKFDAYTGCIWYTLFMDDVFGWKGLVGSSHVFICLVNTNQANCFWNNVYMTFGNGRSEGLRGPFKHWTAMDICGHECGHSLVSITSDLIYQGESGALNESIADIFGTCLERYVDEKTGKKLFDYDIGEDAVKIRSMSNPQFYRNPSRYGGSYWKNPAIVSEANDYGGVHYNSGVGNFLFYVLTYDGRGKTTFPKYNDGLAVNIPKPFPMYAYAKLYIFQ